MMLCMLRKTTRQTGKHTKYLKRFFLCASATGNVTSRRHQHVTRTITLSRIPCTSRNNFQREFSSKQGLYAFKVSLKIFFTLRKSQQVYNVYDKEPWHISDAHLVDHTHKWTNGSKASKTNKQLACKYRASLLQKLGERAVSPYLAGRGWCAQANKQSNMKERLSLGR